MSKLKGKDVTQVNTSGARWEQCLWAYDRFGKAYKIPMDTIIKLINKSSFTKVKKRVHTYLLMEENE